MSILIKAGTGLAAGVAAGALGLAFMPHVESTVQPRRAVEKPQFVVHATAPAPARAAPAVAVAAEASPKPAPSPSVVAAKVDPPKAPPSPAAETVVAAIAPTLIPASPQAAPASPPAMALTSPQSMANVLPQAAPAPPAPVSTPEPAPLKPASEEAARWSVRGLVALAGGDVSSARQFLTRAAEAGDPRAWVALADTYDPTVLKKLGVLCAPGDAQRARDYLAKAAAAGVAAAKDRMAAADQAAASSR